MAIGKALRETLVMRVLFGCNALWVTYVFTGELKKAGLMTLVLATVNTVVFYVWRSTSNRKVG